MEGFTQQQLPISKVSYVDYMYEISLGMILFLQVFQPKLVAIGIILFFLSVVFNAFKKQLVLNSNKSIHLILVLLYLAYGIGCFFTDIPSEAKHVMESKMTFAIFPLLFLWIPKRKLNLAIPIWIFIIGLLIESFYAFGNNFSALISTWDLNYLVTRNAHHHHPTYMSIFYMFGVALLIFGKKRGYKSFQNKWIYLIAVVFCIDYLLCFSLAALLFLTILIALIGIVWFSKKYGIKKSLLIVGLALFGFLALIEITDGVITEIGETAQSIGEYASNPEKFVDQPNKRFTSNEIRLVVWTISIQAIKEQPFGYGTGNTDVVMGNGFQKYHLSYFIENEFNPHNQYLQTWIELGLQGFILLMTIFATIVWIAKKQNNYLLLLLVISFIFNCLFESMFQQASGIVFFTFMTFFLLFFSSQKESV